MSFLWPGILVLAAAVTIPIIIHLLGERRYERFYISSIRLLKRLETDSLRRIKMRQWLILLLRTLGILFLVLALAGPFSGGCRLTPPGKGLLITDSSPSSRFHPDFEELRTRLKQAFPDWPELDMDLSLPAASDPRDLISEFLKETPLDPEHCIILTDLQKNEDTEALLAAVKEKLEKGYEPLIIRLKNQANLTYTKSLYIPSRHHPAGEFIPVTVLISSPEERIPLAYLNVNGKRLAQTRPDDNNEVFFSFLIEKPDEYTGFVKLEDSDHPFNQRYFSLSAGHMIRILYAGNSHSYLYPALQALSAVELNHIRTAEFSEATLSGFDILIVDGLEAMPEKQLNRIDLFARENPVLIIMDRIPDKAWKDFLAVQKTEEVHLPEGSFRQTEIPDNPHPAFHNIRPFAIQRYFRISIENTLKIFQLSGGDPFFIKYDKSEQYIITSPFLLDYNRMGTDAWFTRTIKEILYTITGSYESDLVVGDMIPIRQAGDLIVRPDGHVIRLLEDYTETDIPGVYILRSNDHEYSYSVNWPESETDDRFLNEPLSGFEVLEGSTESVEHYHEALKGRSLTPLFFLLAALCWCGELCLMILNQKKKRTETE